MGVLFESCIRHYPGYVNYSGYSGYSGKAISILGFWVLLKERH